MPDSTPAIQSILLSILREIEDLRSDLTVALGSSMTQSDTPLRLGDAYAAKSVTSEAVTKKYENLRKQIGELA